METLHTIDSWNTINIGSYMSDQASISSNHSEDDIDIKFEPVYPMDLRDTIDADSHTLDHKSVRSNTTNDNMFDKDIQSCDSVKMKLQTLHTKDSSDTIDIDSHTQSEQARVSLKDADNNMMPSDSGENSTRSHLGQSSSHHQQGSKSWTKENMDAALEALRNHEMSLNKASETFGIPSTTLWQRAQRLRIDMSKKDGPPKTWNDESLNNALNALRSGTISASKASKTFGIPARTLYKIARQEGIKLTVPYNATPSTWSPADLDGALGAIRSGQTTVQRIATEFGIPAATLYAHCKKKGIELTKSTSTSWSEDTMSKALETIRLGHMSIYQAAAHYKLPYSSLYGRLRRSQEQGAGRQ